MTKRNLQSLPMLVLLLGITGCPNPKHPTSQHTPKTKQSEIIAQVGTLTITRQAFEKSYQRHGQGIEPKAFLRKMIDEQLLFQEAQRHQLDKTPHIQAVVRKALAQYALKKSFEAGFNPKSIGPLRLQKAYNDRKYLYVKPAKVAAWHILALYPFTVQRGLTKKQKALFSQAEITALNKKREAIRQRVKQLAVQARQAVRKANPKNPEAFKAAVAHLLQSQNKQDPALLAWFKRFHKVVIQHKKTPAKKLAKALTPLLRELQMRPFCDMCFALADHISGLRENWLFEGRPAKPKDLQRLYDTTLRGVRLPVERIRVRNLREFSFQDMVKPFAKAAFGLKDGTYTPNLVATKFGYHIIFRVGHTDASSIPFQKAAPGIRSELYRKQAPKMFRRWLYFIQKRYTIKRYYNRLKSKSPPKK
jgi:hypothetical protein